MACARLSHAEPVVSALRAVISSRLGSARASATLLNEQLFPNKTHPVRGVEVPLRRFQGLPPAAQRIHTLRSDRQRSTRELGAKTAGADCRLRALRVIPSSTLPAVLSAQASAFSRRNLETARSQGMCCISQFAQPTIRRHIAGSMKLKRYTSNR